MVDKYIYVSFDAFTFSPFSNTKLSLYKWLKYCELMILGFSIRQCAEEIDVGVKTSFLIRHSYKGNHSKNPRLRCLKNLEKDAKAKIKKESLMSNFALKQDLSLRKFSYSSSLQWEDNN